ncbi:MAG TPA: hypothetical protein VLJ39_02970 [Tepidisphaeraceae bacterium]|nr:hypothetical protein [Tepidisphaeraceae bacterium]
MRALGPGELPPSIRMGDQEYRLACTVKHDFFAATGFYEDAAGRRVVLKMGRTQDFAGVPMAWVGRWLCRREQRFYARLADLPNVPRVVGTLGETGLVLEHVEGKPLAHGGPIGDEFFPELERLFTELHRRHLAYVDANKTQNILVGADGRPHLIDFQISFDRDELGDNWLGRAVVAHLQGSDRYHLLKHKRRLRPDQLTEDDRHRLEHRSLPLRLHRFMTKPYFKLRRRTFQRLRETGRLLPEGSK